MADCPSLLHSSLLSNRSKKPNLCESYLPYTRSKYLSNEQSLGQNQYLGGLLPPISSFDMMPPKNNTTLSTTPNFGRLFRNQVLSAKSSTENAITWSSYPLADCHSSNPEPLVFDENFHKNSICGPPGRPNFVLNSQTAAMLPEKGSDDDQLRSSPPDFDHFDPPQYVDPSQTVYQRSPAPTPSEYAACSRISRSHAPSVRLTGDDGQFDWGGTASCVVTPDSIGNQFHGSGNSTGYSRNTSTPVSGLGLVYPGFGSYLEIADAPFNLNRLPYYLSGDNTNSRLSLRPEEMKTRYGDLGEASSMTNVFDFSSTCRRSSPLKAPLEVHQEMYGGKSNQMRSTPYYVDGHSDSPQADSSTWLPFTKAALSSETGTNTRGRARTRQKRNVSQRSASKDNYLVRRKQAGWSYKKIKSEGGFTEAESTLRGRYRMLTKNKEQRVRQPHWTERDVRLLEETVHQLASKHSISLSSTEEDGGVATSRSLKGKISWGRVAREIFARGGSYEFGPATCSKKWDAICVKRT